MRREIALTLKAGGRSVRIKAMDAVGPEDCFEMQMNAVLHRFATGEDLTPTIPREVKDFMIKTNLSV